MKCSYCKMNIDDGIIDSDGKGICEWSTCPHCGTRMMGFRDDMMQIAVQDIKRMAKEVVTYLNHLDTRMRQIENPEHLRGYIQVDEHDSKSPTP